MNDKKSELVPKHTFIFLGYHFFLEEGVVRPTVDRWDRLQRALRPFMKKQAMKAREWQSLLGLLAATEKMFPLGLLRMRPLQRHLAVHWSQHRDRDDMEVPVTVETLQWLDWWGDPANVMVGVPLHRRATQTHVYSRGMGGTSGGCANDSQGVLECRGERLTYQSQGIESGNVGDEALCRGAKGSVSTVGLRQFNGGCICKQAGRNSVAGAVGDDTGVLRLASPGEYLGEGTSYTRPLECDRRWSVEGSSSTAYRMVAYSRDSGSNVESLGSTAHRCLCDQIQQQASPLCVSCARRDGIRCGCAVHGLGPVVAVCIPSNGNFRESDTEIETVERNNNSSNSTSMAQAKLVPRSSAAVNRVPFETPGVEENASPAAVGNLPQGAGGLQSSRVALIESAHESKGFSSTVAARMARGQKESTLLVYEGKWKIFVAWCGGRGCDPFAASISLIADFLCFLKDEKKLSLSTIEGYRSAIAGTLRHVTGLEVGKDCALSSLLANFARDKTVKDKRAPGWDLAFVLESL